MNKEKTIGLIGTVAFHALLLLCLLLYYIQTDPQDRYNELVGGVPVMFGNAWDAYGDDEAFGRGNGLDHNVTEPIESDPTMPNHLGAESDATPSPQPSVEPTRPTTTSPARANEQVMTQNTEETVSVEAKKAEREQKAREAAEQEAARIARVEADRKAKEEAERRKNINSQMAGAFGNGSGTGSRGNTHGTGTQGSPAGNGSTGQITGRGGTGGNWNLGGRNPRGGGLQLPSYNVDDYGTVVVDIIVDPQGNVIEATIGRGTNTTNASLRNESIRAAKQTKFTSVSTLNNQKGTITYKFNLN